ncbi:MAG: ABC transporter substrate-binding protein [Gemmatimonadaceae bacterium]
MTQSLRSIALLCLAALAACSGAAESGPIVLGASGPWTEGYGQMNRRGIELALEEVNAARRAEGGGGGDTVVVLFRDDAGSGANAAAIAQEFVADARVTAVIGHVNSGAMVAAAQVYDGQLAAVATTATSPALTGISSWTFRVISSDSANGIRMAQFARTLGRRRAAILYENNSYGRGLTDAFRRNFDGQIVSMDPIDEGAQNFEPYVAYYGARQPDLVFVAGTDASGLHFIREARRQGLSADLLGGDGWTGLAVDTVNSEGVYVGAPFSSDDPRPEVQAFVSAFRARYNATPDHNASLAYDATKLLVHAAELVGRDRGKVRDYLASLDERSAFAGVSGPIRFGADGDPVGTGILITRIERGALKVAEGGR